MIDRIQGTDGIRRPIIFDDDPLTEHMTPLEIFSKLDRLSPGFFKLYCYAFAQWLRGKGRLAAGREILLGSDPRDTRGVFSESVLEALKNAGVIAVNLGVVPTPTVPLLVDYWNAAAGIMLTASHNPPLHHGIKLFLPGDQKAYPVDDRELTAEVLYWGNFCELPVIPGGTIVERADEAIRIFMDYSTRVKNSWLEGELPLDRVLLVVDPAFGSMSMIAGEALTGAGFKNVEEVNLAPLAPVNSQSGVADLEGCERINREDVTNPGSRFHGYDALQKLFELATLHKSDLLSGEKLLLGLIFDADGDRFFCLPFLPDHDALAVLSGDETAVLQAVYLSHHRRGNSRHGLYVNTVESDLEAARYAAKLGFVPKLTAVGDKWVLREAQLARTNLALDFCRSHSLRTVELQSVYANMCANPEASALALDALKNDLESLIPSAKQYLYQTYTSNIDELGYAVGSEETGHNITAGAYADSKDIPFLVLAGDGLKSAFNTIAAILDILGESKANAGFWQKIVRPFVKGFKENRYIYWVGKELFNPGTAFRRDLEDQAVKMLFELFPDLEHEPQLFAEEPTMAYFRSPKDGEQVLACFVRPSGTEDKAGIYLRGSMHYQIQLQELGEKLYLWLWQKIRRRECPESLRQDKLLAKLAHTPGSQSESMKLLQQWGSINPQGELAIMAFIQDLLQLSGDEVNLSALGRKVIELG